MSLVLRLVETRADGVTSSVDVSRPGDLRDITSLGLMLPEAKQILARVQQAVVAAQARDHASLRPKSSHCGECCHTKDWSSRQVAMLFGTVVLLLPGSAVRAAVAARRASVGPRTAALRLSWTSCRRTCPR